MGWEEKALFNTTMPKRPERGSPMTTAAGGLVCVGQFSVCENSSEKVPSARDMLKER